MSKVYRPSVRYDARYKEYVDRLKDASGLDGAQIIRLALFVAGSNPQFIGKLREYGGDEFKLPVPRWNRQDDNMWLSQQGEEQARPTRVHVSEGAQSSEPVLPFNGGIVIKL